MSDFKIYTVEELKEMKPGTVFEHKKLGKCILLRKNGVKYMVFKNNFGASNNISEVWFFVNKFPWNLPMRTL